MEPMVMEAMKDVLRTGQELARRGLVAGTSGNCSARVSDSDLIVITPSSMEYELLLAEDMCIVDMGGEKVEGRYNPSVEVIMHLAIYDARPDVGGIVHTHQKMASAVAVAGKSIPPILEEEVFALGGGVELAKYALPGTRDLATNAVEALGGRNACLLAHHGVIAVGPRIQDALLKAEIVERAAEIFIMSTVIGGPKIVPFMQEDSQSGGPGGAT